MPAIKDWLSAARLRTLPLAFSSIITGAAMAVALGQFDAVIFTLALLTTLCLQVLSNYANDYGDFQQGTDDASRVGPMRAVQSGRISAQQMKQAVILMAILSLISGLALLLISGIGFSLKGLVLLGLGLAAIAAAIKYTAGSNPYGYAGLGDISVFIFFGMLGVLGSYYLHGLQLPITTQVFPAAAIGFLSTAVLHLNNMRDAIPDKQAGKLTVATRLGPAAARMYHFCLISFGLICMICYSVIMQRPPLAYIYLAIAPLLVIHLIKTMRTHEGPLLDPELKKVAISTFLLSILFCLGEYISA